MNKHKSLTGKLAKLALALVMALAMVITAVPALAADETHSIIINQPTGSKDTATHTYAAYQIFTGSLNTTDDTLGQITWGSGVDQTKLTGDVATAIKTALGDTTLDVTDAAKVAAALTNNNVKAFAQAIAGALSSTSTASNAGTTTISGLANGYYLVMDSQNPTGDNGAKTSYILNLVPVKGKDVTVEAKEDVPTVTKKVQENSNSEWQDAADYAIGDDIPYKITGTLPSNFADYKTYTTYTFTDTLSDGLDIVRDDAHPITVKVGDTDVTNRFNISVEDRVLTVSLNSGEDLKKWTNPALSASSQIVVYYTAKLNDNAVIGSNNQSHGNPNTVNLTFSNNPNAGGDGDTGKTPNDKVTVFTYEIKALKVKATDDAAIDQTAYDALSDIEKANYLKVGDKYQKVEALSGAGFTLYKKGSDGNYTAVGSEIKGETTFEFKGTDAGEYKLVESTVPSGYNKAADIEITVTATYDDTADEPQLKSLSVTPDTAGFTVTTTTETDGTHITTDGQITGKVLNQKGSTLPSTGGIGTTIFYVCGAILIIGAAMVLVFRRKKSAEH